MTAAVVDHTDDRQAIVDDRVGRSGTGGTEWAEPRSARTPQASADAAGSTEGETRARDVRRTVDAALKRTLDIAVAATMLLLVLPVMLVIVVAILLESRGPVFYRAERVGRGGRVMQMLKFRKMAPDAGGARLTTAADSRLTRVGAVLAKTKLDELPQFINVLRGDMSLVGPRPEDPGFVALREGDYAEILKVRPGITGLSQIAFAAESRILSKDDPVAHYLERIFPAKCGLDRLYVRGASVATDLRILAWTASAVVLGREVAVDRATGRMNLRRRPVEEPVLAAPRPQHAICTRVAPLVETMTFETSDLAGVAASGNESVAG